jgi:glycosyltransferase involved in cell wall biosynthesis
MDSIAASTLVLIPAYNAGSSLADLIRRIRSSTGEMHILVVDDGSQDNTSDVAQKAGVALHRHQKNLGKGAALQTGFDLAKSQEKIDFILTLDADLQHQPEDIPKFFDAQKQTGANLIIGWRERRGTKMPMHRILSNTLTSALVSIKTGKKIKDSQCGFRLIQRKVFENIHCESNGYEAETEFLIKAARQGFSIGFVPVNTVYGNEKSYMTHWKTTMNFIRVLIRNYA